MPMYEYHCPQCGDFERIQKFSDPVLTQCPTCQRPVQKKISTPSFQLKGSGWYADGYGNPLPKQKETKDKKENIKDENKKSNTESPKPKTDNAK